MIKRKRNDVPTVVRLVFYCVYITIKCISLKFGQTIQSSNHPIVQSSNHDDNVRVSSKVIRASSDMHNISCSHSLNM